MKREEQLKKIKEICKKAQKDAQFVRNYPLEDYSEEVTDIYYINQILDIIQGWH